MECSRPMLLQIFLRLPVADAEYQVAPTHDVTGIGCYLSE